MAREQRIPADKIGSTGGFPSLQVPVSPSEPNYITNIGSGGHRPLLASKAYVHDEDYK